MMKRSVCCLVLLLALLLSFTACGSAKPDNSESKNSTDEISERDANTGTDVQSENDSEPETGPGSVSVDEGLLTVDITLSASLVQNSTEEDFKQAVKEHGFLSYRINNDGSVTYTMTKSKRNELLQEYKKSIDDSINDLLYGENKIESFTRIEYNDDCTEFSFYVDAEKYTLFDGMAAPMFYGLGAWYQTFAGINPDDIDVIVNIINKDTGEVMNTGSYKVFSENMANTPEDFDFDEESSDND